MSDQSHTPGPWYLKTEPVTPDYGHPYMRLDAGDGVGDANGIGGFHISGIISAPDARLIAAAPDMLAALKNTLSLLKCFTRETDDVAKAAWDEAEAAIAKATGAQS